MGCNIPYLLSKLYLFFVSLSTMLDKLDDGLLSDVTAIYETEEYTASPLSEYR